MPEVGLEPTACALRGTTSSRRSAGGLGRTIPPFDAEDIQDSGRPVYRRSVARLFSGELAAFEVIKLKDVVEGIEASVNKVEKLSDVVEAIAVKHT